MIEITGVQVDRARPVVQAFSPARLTLARQVVGRTKRQLAEAIDKTAAAVTQFEFGRHGQAWRPWPAVRRRLNCRCALRRRASATGRGHGHGAFQVAAGHAGVSA